jgi:hypothetical protein
VIVITTVYTQEPVSSYASEVAASIGGSVELTPVATRGRVASRIDGPRPTVVWTERFGVIGRLEMSPGSSTDDLVGLADTLMTRSWAWPVPVVATARAACGPVDSGFDIPPGIAPGYTTGYFRKCDLDWSRHFIRADVSGGFPIEVFATRTSTKAIAWFYPDCAGLPEGFAPVGSPPLKRCSANNTATTAAAKN